MNTKDLIDIQILRCLSKEDSYTYKILNDIKENISITESSLYPILKRLENISYLETYKETIGDRSRKYLRLTTKGKDRLEELENKEMKGEVKEMSKDNFRTFDYTSITVSKDMEPVYIDTYESFGWELTDNNIGFDTTSLLGSTKLSFRRDRRVPNKTELLKLQRKSEVLFKNIQTMEANKPKMAMIKALGLGIVGCAFLAISVFSFLDSSWFIFAIAGAIGLGLWIPPYFIYKNTLEKDIERLNPLIDETYDKISDLCEEANALIKSSN